jgi:hypothetical protein
VGDRDPRAELEQLRLFVENLAQGVAALEGLLKLRPLSPVLAPLIVQSPVTSSTAQSSSSLGREELIGAITQWRLERGIEVPQRYLRNRSTAHFAECTIRSRRGLLIAWDEGGWRSRRRQLPLIELLINCQPGLLKFRHRLIDVLLAWMHVPHGRANISGAAKKAKYVGSSSTERM